MFDFLHKKAQDATPPALPEGTVRRRYSIEGQVQGVGFRYRARYAAQTLELTGWVENEDDGSVTLEVQGDPDQFMRLFAMIQKSDYIRITGIRQKDLPPDPWERGPLSQSLSSKARLRGFGKESEAERASTNKKADAEASAFLLF